jgi:hypothetical protein
MQIILVAISNLWSLMEMAKVLPRKFIKRLVRNPTVRIWKRYFNQSMHVQFDESRVFQVVLSRAKAILNSQKAPKPLKQKKSRKNKLSKA